MTGYLLVIRNGLAGLHRGREPTKGISKGEKAEAFQGEPMPFTEQFRHGAGAEKWYELSPK